jgi:hypothetical protein
MKSSTPKVLEALSFDPLDVAEQLTGQSYKTDESTSSLGMGLFFLHNQHKREMLERAGDTHYPMKATTMLALLLKDGFELLLTHPFTGKSWDGEPCPDERAYVLFCRRRGILVWMETFSRGSADNPEGSVNSVKFYFNWRPNREGVYLSRYSGHSVKDPAPLFKGEPSEYNPEGRSYAVSGDIDGREGMFAQLDWMEASGQFITPWLDQPFLWLLTYMDTEKKDYDHEAITAERIGRLPIDVQEAIRGKPKSEGQV